MKSLFGRKLFVLFLLFSLIPSILMAVLGYYFTVESSHITASDSQISESDIIDYYNDFITGLITAQLNDMTAPSLDFSIIISNNSYKIDKNILDSNQTKQVADAAINNEHGFVDLDTAVVQYVSLKNENEQIIGGVVHDRNFLSLLSNIQKDFTRNKISSEIKLSYITFIGIIYFILSIVTVILAYLFSVKYAKNIAEPISALSQTTKAIAKGNFNQRVEITANDEIGMLIDSFNDMASQLKSITNKLTQTERVAAWRSIARRFAHELKNPLQPITISLYQIENKLKNENVYEDVKNMIQAASSELKHLTNLAERFSHLAKLPPPDKQLTDMNKFIETFSKLYPQDNNQAKLKTILPDEKIEIEIDQTYFREVLHNLVKNGFEASPENSVVELSLYRKGNTISISVRDFGHGMPASVIDSARMPYFTTKKEGSGLGLAIVEKIVTESGGNMIIDSAEGLGTTITISLNRI